MNTQKRPVRREKTETPLISNDQLTSLWSQRAGELGGVQMVRANGTPIIGAIVPMATNVRTKRSTLCKLACCSEKRPIVSWPVGLAPRTSEFPERPEPEVNDWVRVEKRSVRRLKTRAKYQKENKQENYVRPSVLYAMED
jgi:hypothetical protein